MSPRWLLSLSSVTGWTARITFLGCLLTMALLFTTHSEASVTLRVDETRTRILLEHQPATVLLPVDNLSNTPLQTRITNRKRAEVPPGSSTRESFDIKATASIRNGKERITASALTQVMRFGMTARTAASSVYDYYNPDAKASHPEHSSLGKV